MPSCLLQDKNTFYRNIMVALRLMEEQWVGEKRDAGYATVKGDVLDGEQLWALIEGLQANDLLHYTHLLTGLNTRVKLISFDELQLVILSTVFLFISHLYPVI